MLYFTSFIFGTCSLHAAHAGYPCLAALFMLQHGLSSTYHSHYTRAEAFLGGRAVRLLDKGIARALWAAVLYHTCQLPFGAAAGAIYGGIAYVPTMYYLKCAPAPPYRPFEVSLPVLLHGSLHLAAGLSSHLLFWLNPRE